MVAAPPVTIFNDEDISIVGGSGQYRGAFGEIVLSDTDTGCAVVPPTPPPAMPRTLPPSLPTRTHALALPPPLRSYLEVIVPKVASF